MVVASLDFGETLSAAFCSGFGEVLSVVIFPPIECFRCTTSLESGVIPLSSLIP
jgi:hypothetical protein